MDDLISRKAMREAMYHEAMEKDSNEQKWDGGCWIRYKMFERVIESLPSADPLTAKRIVGCDRNGMTMWYQCDMCHEPIDIKDTFCRRCGRRFEDG